MFKKLSRRLASFERPRIYVMPTRAGWLWLLMSIYLVLMSAVYSNVSVQFLGFLLLSLYALAMTWTHVHLRGLQETKAQIKSGFSKEETRLFLSGVSRQADPREGLSLKIRCRHKKSGQEKTLELQIGRWEHDGPFKLSLPFELSLPRGAWTCERVAIQTRAPFGLFRAWRPLLSQFDFWVYPERKEIALESGALAGEVSLPEPQSGDEDFAFLSESSWMDRASHVVPKPTSNEASLVIKNFEQSAGGEKILDWDRLPGELEDRLSYCSDAVLRTKNLQVHTPHFTGRIMNPDQQREALMAWAEA